MTNDGKNRTEFLPVFPAACTCLAPKSLGLAITPNLGPYMTSVGATNGTVPEQAAYFSLKEDSRTTSVDRPTNLMRSKRSWTRSGIRLTPVYTSGFQQPRPRFVTLIRFNRSASGRGFPDFSAQGLKR